MTERIGDGPIQDEYRAMMIEVASALDRFFNGNNIHEKRQTGFVLLVFPFGGKEGRCNYISNGADRKDIMTMFKEQIARFEGQPEMKGHA